MDLELPTAEFGFPGPLRDKLVAAILRGEKTSSTGLLAEYEREGSPVGDVGRRELVVDSDGRGVAVIEMTEVEVKRMEDVDLQFAIDEGEGFETVAQWRDAHVRFFTSPEMVEALGDPAVAVDDDTLVVCTRFRLVDQLSMRVERLDHLVLTVADVERTVDWYARVLGLKPVTFDEGRRALRFGDQRLNLHIAGAEIAPHAREPRPGSADLCFVTSVPLRDAVEHFRRCGVEPELGPVERTGTLGSMTSVYLRDPDGNLVEIAAYS